MWHLWTLEGSHFRYDTCAPRWAAFSDVASMDLSGQSFQIWHLWTSVGIHLRCDTCAPWQVVTSDVASLDLSGRSLQMWLLRTQCAATLGEAQVDHAVHLLQIASAAQHHSSHNTEVFLSQQPMFRKSALLKREHIEKTMLKADDSL